VLEFAPVATFSREDTALAFLLVTGTSKGIGLATALVLGRSGHTVYATMRDPSRSPELARVVERERLPIKISGIIDTSMSRRISGESAPSAYPHGRRMAALFASSLQRPTPPLIVAEKILEIISSDTWKLRHPVRPDAEGYMGWRASMSDEQWVNWGAADDETWYRNVESTLGINARPQAIRKHQS
jgi:hypothetical protein